MPKQVWWYGCYMGPEEYHEGRDRMLMMVAQKYMYFWLELTKGCGKLAHKQRRLSRHDKG